MQPMGRINHSVIDTHVNIKQAKMNRFHALRSEMEQVSL